MTERDRQTQKEPLVGSPHEPLSALTQEAAEAYEAGFEEGYAEAQEDSTPEHSSDDRLTGASGIGGKSASTDLGGGGDYDPPGVG
jgi:hypothetical protein